MGKIQFSDFEIDLDLFTLAKNGRPLAIGPRPLDVLICLIRNRERVVHRNQLMEEVWQTNALSPATIPTAILEVRRTLGDDASNQI